MKNVSSVLRLYQQYSHNCHPVGWMDVAMWYDLRYGGFGLCDGCVDGRWLPSRWFGAQR